MSVLLNTTAPGAITPSFAARTDFAAGSDPYSVALGDLNGDGKPDLAVANIVDSSVSVLLDLTAPGAATPSFASHVDFVARGTGDSFVVIKDLNGDGTDDLAVTDQIGASGSGGDVGILLNTAPPRAATPSFAASVDFATGYRLSVRAASADLNADGKPDLVVANYGSNTVSVLLNTTAPGTVTPSFAVPAELVAGANPFFIALGDLNGDGKPDLAVMSGTDVNLFLNTTVAGATTPAFAARADFGAGASPDSIALGDFNGDKKLDLAVTGLAGTVNVLLNTTAPGAPVLTFAAPVSFVAGGDGFSVAAGDFNGDGKLDLVTANSDKGTVSVLLNQCP